MQELASSTTAEPQASSTAAVIAASNAFQSSADQRANAVGQQLVAELSAVQSLMQGFKLQQPDAFYGVAHCRRCSLRSRQQR